MSDKDRKPNKVYEEHVYYNVLNITPVIMANKHYEGQAIEYNL